MDSQQKRKIVIFSDNLLKIIDNGIKPNLVKLDKSSKFISLNKNNISRNNFSNECMNARLTIQQLRANLTELEKCYLTLKNLDGHSDYETLVESIKKNVSQDINNFIKLNQEINLSSNEYGDQEINSENQIQTQLTREVEELNDTQKNYEEIQSINRDLNDLQEIMIKFGNLVHDQQNKVDQIEENIETASDNIHQGTLSLIKASSATIAPITCAVAGATIFGPIGALISFKLSTGIVSALGGSALSYSLASYAKKRRKKQALSELKNVVESKTE